MTKSVSQIALTSAEVGEVLTYCGESALLVGAQALSFWATHFDIEPAGLLAAAVASDVEFLGSAKVAANLGRSLGWKIWAAGRGDPTTRVARLTKSIPGMGVKQIDFLSTVLGLKTTRVEQRAVKVTFPNGGRIRVLHPLDVLESRLRTMLILPVRQRAIGAAQAALAIEVVASFLASVIEGDADRRVIHETLERVAKLTLNKRLVSICIEHGLDPLTAVRINEIPADYLNSPRWQQILLEAAKIRKQGLRRAERIR